MTQGDVNNMLNLLRVEAINFDQSIDDTNQLSVVRGGGLLMREIIIDLAEALKTNFDPGDNADLKVLSTGGSIGIFLYPASSIEDVLLVEALEAALTGQGVTEEAPNWLKTAIQAFRKTETGKLAQLLSFGISVQPLAGNGAWETISYQDFQTANNAALTNIRRQQMRQPNVVLDASSATEVCSWDGLRPVGSGDATVRKERVSESVYQRFRVGRNAKHDGPLFRFYSREIAKSREGNSLIARAGEVLQRLADEPALSESTFPVDLEGLCKAVESARHPTKLAVIYADGNKFSRILAAGNPSLADYQAWDRMLQESRADFLSSLLVWLDEKRAPGEPIPLEIFLWGGDEIMFAVPADLALEAISRFFEFTSNQVWKDRKLTYSLGMVICSYKTPIQRIKALAWNLAERVKNQLGDELEHQINAWLYAVLESVDTPTDLDRFLEERYGAAHEHMLPLLANPEPFFEFSNWANELLASTSRAQLYAMANEISREPSWDEAIRRFEEVTGIARTELREQILSALPHMTPGEDESTVSSILHWLELADYWPKPVQPSSADTNVDSELEVVQ